MSIARIFDSVSTLFDFKFTKRSNSTLSAFDATNALISSLVAISPELAVDYLVNVRVARLTASKIYRPILSCNAFNSSFKF